MSCFLTLNILKLIPKTKIYTYNQIKSYKKLKNINATCMNLKKDIKNNLSLNK